MTCPNPKLGESGVVRRLAIPLGAFSLLYASGCGLEIEDVELPRHFVGSASVYEVRGVNRVFDDKHLNFGPYLTRTVNRGSVVRESSKLLRRKKVARHRFGFTMFDDSGHRADAKAEGVLSEEDASLPARWLRNEWWYLGQKKLHRNHLSGSIDVEGRGVFEFLIPDAYTLHGDREEELRGELLHTKDGETVHYAITSFVDRGGVKVLQNTSAHMLVKKNEIIGAVQHKHPEKVWINDSASPLDRFLAANLLGLLLLQKDLSER